MKLSKVVVTASLLALSLSAPLTTISSASAEEIAVSGPEIEFTVVAEDGADAGAVQAAIENAGGSVTDQNANVGTFSVTAPANGFIEAVSADDSVLGASRNRRIGTAPKANVDRQKLLESGADVDGAATTGELKANTSVTDKDPLDDKLWGHEAINAFEARKKQDGSKKVTVGVMDTGVDKTHPDIAQNFNAELSHSFAENSDPAGGIDPNGHGTHVSGTIAAAQNGMGISGIAPDVSLVDLRVATDEGYFFLDPVVNGLTYAGDAGIDVVNMSFYVDPWLYNCLNNPADSAEEQAEQRAIITGVNRALTYAHNRGVTLVSALGNSDTDLGTPEVDTTSPNYPGGTERDRVIDNNTCWDMPTEGSFVIGASAIGPTGVKSYYSNYGLEQITVAAPGGDVRALTNWDTAAGRNYDGGILSSVPTKVLQDNVNPNTGEPEPLVDAGGTEITPAGLAVGVQKSVASDGTIGFYQPYQGTSMAAPHTTAVAALIVSQFGWNDSAHPGTRTMHPWLVEQILTSSATETACPAGGTQTYGDLDQQLGTTFTATCEGDTSFNGFFGHGMINAQSAVSPFGR